MYVVPVVTLVYTLTTHTTGAQWLHSAQTVSPVLTSPSVTSNCTALTGNGFSAAFPGIKPHLLTLASNFNTPIYREVILALGICSVSKQSCSNILAAGPGSAITIVVGGAAESLNARPGTADLTLRKR